MGNWRRKTKWFILIISVGSLVTLFFLNKGETVEISSHIDVGERVIIPSAKGNLVGSYFRPSESENSPAVVMVNGSGRTSYRSAWDPEKERYFWKPVTEMLNDAGYAVLLLEKRGINGSEGHWKKESFEDRGDNVISAVHFLKNLDGIDSNRIGLMGHSQGGWVVQLAATKNPDDISFVVNLAGPSISVLEQILDDYTSELVCKGLEEDEVKEKVEVRRKLLLSYKMLSKFVKTGYLSRIIDYDPETVVRSLTIPLYSVYAENDHLVIPDKNINLLKAGLKKARNHQYVIRTIPNANHHFFISDKCFSRSELNNKEPSGQFLNVIKDFIEWERKMNIQK